MKLYLVNLNTGKIEKMIINTGETFKMDTEKYIVVNEFYENEDQIHIVFFRRRTIY